MKKLLLAVLVLIASISMVHAQPAGYLYSKAFSITNSSSQLDTNYTIAIVVNTQALISAGKMRDSGQDIRFGTPCTGTKLFNYYIDSGINTTHTLIYVKIDTLKPNSTRTIYMFYGNSSATAVSNFNALDGPHTMFNNQDLFTTQGGFANQTEILFGDTVQAGVYFQPNKRLLVTGLGAYVPDGSTQLVMQLTSYDAFSNANLLINKTLTTSATGNQWSFTTLAKPIPISVDSSYAVNILIGDCSTCFGPDYYFGSNSIPPYSPEVTVLGAADGFPFGFPPALQSPPFAFASNEIEGYADIKYYAEPVQSIYVTYLADTAINASAGIDPVSKLVCPGTTTTFTAVASGLAPTYQWQVNTGNSWVNVNTGSLYSGVNLPTLTVSGTTAAMNGYKYRAYMTSTCGTGYSQPATLSINISAPVTPVASITGPNPACQYTNATYTLSTNVQGATFTFYRNSTAAVTGVNGNQYAFTPGSADTVYAVVTAPNNAAIACYTVPVAVTNSIRIMVGSNFTPTDSIAASSNNGCQGSIVDFTGYGNVVGGTYQWYVNNTAVAGATASTYSYAPNNGDQVTERINTPANGCYSLTNVVSNPVVATTTYSITPSIQVVGPTNAKAGQQVTFTANITNFCASYTIYWYNDYMLIDSTINTNTLNFKKGTQGNDFISAVIVPQSPCAGTCYQSSKQSNLLTLTFTEPNVGVGNVTANSGISMYPNPFTSKITVNGLKAGDRLMVYDMTGRTMSAEYQAAGITGEYLLQTLAPGHYILRVTDSEGNVKANLPMSKL